MYPNTLSFASAFLILVEKPLYRNYYTHMHRDTHVYAPLSYFCSLIYGQILAFPVWLKLTTNILLTAVFPPLSCVRNLTIFGYVGHHGWQLVQFLLKQAGVDKRIGDLYGNRDLLNIARNMARGLKVCHDKRYFYFKHWSRCLRLGFPMLIAGCWECVHPTPASSIPNHGKHQQGAVKRCGLPLHWKSLSAGEVCCFNLFGFEVWQIITYCSFWITWPLTERTSFEASAAFKWYNWSKNDILLCWGTCRAKMMSVSLLFCCWRKGYMKFCI